MSSLKYTCLTCNVAFVQVEGQKKHFISNWHRYNCKRKCAELPPVSIEEYGQRVLEQQALIEEEKNPISYCKPCGKMFNTKNSYKNHIGSKRHEEKVKLFENKATISQNSKTIDESVDDGDDSEVEDVDSDEWEDEPIASNNCLFCSHHSANFDKNMKHMTNIHSFYVPDLAYCINLEDLITYLGEKVGSGHQCLWCNEKSRDFEYIAGVQSHMRAKGHCMMKHEGVSVLEYGSFYDYSSSYPDADLANPDDEAPRTQQLNFDGYELILPSGATVGHRSLKIYYKQWLKPEKSIVLRKSGNTTLLRNKLMTQYKALGWSGATQADVKKKARDLHYMRNVRDKQYMRLGVKANKLQPHFRQQILC